METIQLKQASLSDLNTLQILGKQTFAETFTETNTAENMNAYLEESFNTKQLTKELSDRNSIFFIAYDKGKGIGYLKVNSGEAQLELKAQNSLEIQRIYVLKEYLGKAVGQLLFEKALTIAREKKIDFIWLGVWEKNPRAISFYKKNGFVEFDKHSFQLGDDLQTDILMKLQLR